ncbi:hypothetical protein D3C71_1610740 [compost metagenome]
MIGPQPVIQLHIPATRPVGRQIDQASAQGPGAHVVGQFVHGLFLLFTGLFEGGAPGDRPKQQTCQKSGQPAHSGLLAFAAILIRE